MAKKIEFKKKPLKSEETEQKLDQWLEKKTNGDTAAAPQSTVNEPEQTGAPVTATETVKTEVAESAPETVAIKPEPAKAKSAKKQVSFDKQEEELEIAQVTFHMPKSLQRRLKFECFRQDTTIKDYVIKLLDKQLPKDTM